MDRPEPLPSARVRVRHGLGGAGRPITLIEVDGEHDFESRATLVSALEEVAGHLVVDLTFCDFMDQAVIGAMLAKAHDLEERGYRFELVVPPSGPLSQTVDVLGLRDVGWVRDEVLDGGAQEG